MENRKAKQKRTNIVICLILSFILALMFLPISTLSKNDYVFADSTYTTVLEDLSKDSAFSMDDYPTIEEDYSLQVIQVAESKDRELFVYVYQPSGTLRASSINISTKTGNELEYINYTLVLLNSSGILFKYKVRDFIVSTNAIRYYDISSVYRPFNSNIDTQPDNNNIITEVAYPVSKLYVVNENEGNPVTSCYVTDTVVVTDKFVGFCRYNSGYVGSPGMGLSFVKPGYDSHFVAFKTDYNIDKLYEADVYYTTQTYQYIKSKSGSIVISENEYYGDIIDNYAYLKYTDCVDLYVAHGFKGHSYSFERIQTVNEFFETEQTENIFCVGLFNVNTKTVITDEAKSELNNMQYVLRFVETEFKDQNTTYTYTKEWTTVGSVTILRLKFETDGAVYSIGVIDNKTTEAPDPVNKTITEITSNIPDWLKPILYAILVVILIGIAIPFLPYIIHGLGVVLKYLFLAIWYVLKYTAIGIYWLFAWPFYLKKR